MGVEPHGLAHSLSRTRYAGNHPDKKGLAVCMSEQQGPSFINDDGAEAAGALSLFVSYI